MTFGSLTQFVIYAVMVGTAAAALAEMLGEVQRAAGAMERLIELRNATPAIVAPPNPIQSAGAESAASAIREVRSVIHRDPINMP